MDEVAAYLFRLPLLCAAHKFNVCRLSNALNASGIDAKQQRGKHATDTMQRSRVIAGTHGLRAEWFSRPVLAIHPFN